MKKLIGGTAAVLAASLLTISPATAVQPAPKCKVLSTSSAVQWVALPHGRAAAFVVTETRSRCRGKIVVTTSTAPLPPTGPR